MVKSRKGGGVALRRKTSFPRWLWWSVGGVVGLLLVAAGLLWLEQYRLTQYLEGPAFRAELDKETSKGLHFQGHYDPLIRTGFLSARTDGFSAADGVKAFKTLEAKGVTGQFNPLGIFLRRWQIDSIHIDSAVAHIQVYEPKPEVKPPKPWYAIFLPDRVYLKEVRCDHGDILWKLNKKDSGFVNSKVLVTPHGRDFEYRLNDGDFVLPFAPKMPVDHVHMLITKQLMSLYEFVLTPKGGGTIHAEGQAGLKEDKSTRVQVDLEGISISPWIPTSWGDQVKGRASGHLTVEGPDRTMQALRGEGELTLSGAQMLSIPFLDYAASATQNASLKYLDLDECVIAFRWQSPALDIHEIRIEAQGQFKITGAMTVTQSGALSGTLKLGVTEANLAWLPKAKEEIFTRQAGGYYWTTVTLSGTLQAPQNDLTPRLAQALRKSPVESTGLFFRGIGEWFKQTFTGD